jgi:type IV secretion system protein TrbB
LSSLLALPSVQADRCLVLEDTQEIRIEVPDHVRMLTSADVGMRTLVQLSLRYRPDRIILGEMRSEVFRLRSWKALGNPLKTGAPGGIRTHDPRIRNPVLYPAELRALYL